MSSKQTISLDPLKDTYELIGELSAKGGTARTIIGKRRSDGVDVLITVAETPSGDEGNALSHVAADVTLLSGLEHRGLVPVLEGRWLEHDAIAVVRRRVYAPTLDELLARRDEEFAFPRIAVILQELNGLLEWARAQKVVHRALDLDTVHLEPGSDRVLASFAIRALPLTDMPGAADDARTVATLARAMLTRSAMDSERANLPLAEVRPGLPTTVIEQTEALLASPSAETGLTDVNGYIAAIAMADAIKRGETACEESKQRIIEEERRARQEIEAQHRECERVAAEQERAFQHEKAAFLKQKEAIERALAREKESIQRALAAEKEALAKATPAVAPQLSRMRVPRPMRDLWRHRPGWSQNWKAGAATAAALLIAIFVFAGGHDEQQAAPAATRTKPRVTISDSAAGTVVRPQVVHRDSVPQVPADLLSGIATRAASAPPMPARRRRRVSDDGYLNRPAPVQDPYLYQRPAEEYRPPVQEPNPYRPSYPGQLPPQQPAPTYPTDTPRRPDTVPRPDSVYYRPQLRLNLDSIVRSRRDTVRRDTLIRRDTFPRPRD